MDLDKIGGVMGAIKMASGKPEKPKNSGWGLLIVGIFLAVVGVFLVLAPENIIKVEGSRIFLYVPLVFGVVFIIAGIVSIITNKKKQQELASMKNSGVRYQGIIVGVNRTGLSTNDQYGNMVEQNDVVIEVQTPQGVKQTKVRLSGVGDYSFIKYRQNPTPITVYGDASDLNKLVADEDEVIAATSSIVEGMGEIFNRHQDQ